MGGRNRHRLGEFFVDGHVTRVGDRSRGGRADRARVRRSSSVRDCARGLRPACRRIVGAGPGRRRPPRVRRHRRHGRRLDLAARLADARTAGTEPCRSESGSTSPGYHPTDRCLRLVSLNARPPSIRFLDVRANALGAAPSPIPYWSAIRWIAPRTLLVLGERPDGLRAVLVDAERGRSSGRSAYPATSVSGSPSRRRRGWRCCSIRSATARWGRCCWA